MSEGQFRGLLPDGTLPSTARSEVEEMLSGVGGATTVDELTDATTVGRALVKAANAAAARGEIQAASGEQGALADTAVQPADLPAVISAVPGIMRQDDTVQARFLGFLTAHPGDPEVGDWWILLEAG